MPKAKGVGERPCGRPKHELFLPLAVYESEMQTSGHSVHGYFGSREQWDISKRDEELRIDRANASTRRQRYYRAKRDLKGQSPSLKSAFGTLVETMIAGMKK